MGATEEKGILEFRGITKTFPGVVALDRVSFGVAQGEVHGLVGENGAGKSTLIKILCGVYGADEGEMRIDGKAVHITNAQGASAHGIQVMHQEISVLPNMTVAENLLAQRMPTKRRFFVDDQEMNRLAREMLERVGLEGIDPKRKIGELSLAAQQMVHLARIAATNPKVVLLDEPTASLTMNEAERLFEVIGRFRQAGVAVIYISHYLEEVLRVCDRVTVLRDGCYITTYDARQARKEQVVMSMIGKPLKRSRRTSQARDSVVLALDDVTCVQGASHVSLKLREQEVLGLYGLNGAGKTETLRAIMGLDKLLEGRIELGRRDITGKPIAQIAGQGIAFVPEDRRRQGLVLEQSVLENGAMGHEAKYRRRGFVSMRLEAEDVKRATQAMRVKTPSLLTKVASLSGGNQQKVILARSISKGARVFLLDEPTVGIDVGAREEIYQMIDRIVREGASVVLASSDMTEILDNCDRIAVIANGRIAKVLDREEATEEELLLHAMGE